MKRLTILLGTILTIAILSSPAAGQQCRRGLFGRQICTATVETAKEAKPAPKAKKAGRERRKARRRGLLRWLFGR